MWASKKMTCMNPSSFWHFDTLGPFAHEAVTLPPKATTPPLTQNVKWLPRRDGHHLEDWKLTLNKPSSTVPPPKSHPKLAESCDFFIRKMMCCGTPLKFNMEPQNWWFQTMCFPFQGGIFRFHVKLWGCIANFPKAKGSFGKGNTIRSIEVIPQITNWKEGEHSQIPTCCEM